MSMSRRYPRGHERGVQNLRRHLAQKPCPHGMPTPASCVECMADGPVAPPTSKPAAIRSNPFKAAWNGQCTECDLPIWVGERIIRVEHHDRTVYEHAHHKETNW